MPVLGAHCRLDEPFRSGGFLISGPQRSAFLLFLTSRALSSVAFQGSAVAIGWLIYDRTRNPFDLGLIGLFSSCRCLR